MTAKPPAKGPPSLVQFDKFVDDCGGAMEVHLIPAEDALRLYAATFSKDALVLTLASVAGSVLQILQTGGTIPCLICATPVKKSPAAIVVLRPYCDMETATAKKIGCLGSVLCRHDAAMPALEIQAAIGKLFSSTRLISLTDISSAGTA